MTRPNPVFFTDISHYYDGYLNYFCQMFGVFRKKFPKYISEISYEKRLKSFESDYWDNVPVKVTELAEFGFSSIGDNDLVICFCCGLVAYQWEYTDDVFIEHAKLSPNCLLVKLNMDIVNRRQELLCPEAHIAVMDWQFSDIYKGLREKGHTIADIKYLLYERFQRTKTNFETIEDAVEKLTETRTEEKLVHPCKICLSREISVVFLKCGHLAACSYCAPCLTTCPIGKEPITACAKVYLS